MNAPARRGTTLWGRIAWAVLVIALGITGCGKEESASKTVPPPAQAAADPAKPAVQAPAGIGKVHSMQGDVWILGARGEERAQPGVSIAQGERVRTMPNAWALLVMSDGGSITVREDTELGFEDYRYDPDAEPQQNAVTMSLVRGALRSITGLIGQTHSAGYQIRTPTATIGIRGTDHEPAYYPPPAPGQKAEHPPGTYDKVNTGESVIRRPSGETPVRRGQTAFASADVKARPQILERPPVFYERHAKVDQQVVVRREEAQRQFAEDHRRRQAERQRQKDLDAQKKQLDNQKKKQDERRKDEQERLDRQKAGQAQQEALKKKQDEQKKQDEKRKQDGKKKQDDAKKGDQRKGREQQEKAQARKKDAPKPPPSDIRSRADAQARKQQGESGEAQQDKRGLRERMRERQQERQQERPQQQQGLREQMEQRQQQQRGQQLQDPRGQQVRPPQQQQPQQQQRQQQQDRRKDKRDR